MNEATNRVHTGRFKVRQTVQSRDVRKENIDAHYVNKE